MCEPRALVMTGAAWTVLARIAERNVLRRMNTYPQTPSETPSPTYITDKPREPVYAGR